MGGAGYGRVPLWALEKPSRKWADPASWRRSRGSGVRTPVENMWWNPLGIIPGWWWIAALLLLLEVAIVLYMERAMKLQVVLLLSSLLLSSLELSDTQVYEP